MSCFQRTLPVSGSIARKYAGEIAVIEDVVVDGHGGQAAVHFVVAPDGPGLADVAALRGVDGIHVAGALAMLGVLAHGDEHAVVVDHGRGDQFVAGAASAKLVDRAFRVALEIPELLAGFRLVGIEPPVAAGEDDLLHAADHADRRAGPLAVQDLVAGADLVPDDFARLLVHGDEAGGVGGGDDDVAFIDAVAGDDIDQVRRRYSASWPTCCGGRRPAP